MGVSYAAPAYYADRLCERARCYLREFFVPSRDRRDQLDADRRRLETLKGIWPLKDMNNMNFSEKEQERARVRQLKEEIDEILKERTWKSAQDRLDAKNEAQDKAVKKKREDLLKTMYWM